LTQALEEDALAKCGDFGNLTKAGSPCGFSIPEGKTICAYHSRTPAERHDLAMKGALNASLKQTLPDDFEMGALQTADDVKTFVRTMLQWVLKKPIERWRAAEARGLLGLFVQIEQVQATQRLADAVLTSTHGGQSLVFLNQFMEGAPDGRRKIPSRVKTLTDEPELAS
jgi:hypothetical protein